MTCHQVIGTEIDAVTAMGADMAVIATGAGTDADRPALTDRRSTPS